MIKVTCAIIVDEEGMVLVTQRSERMKLPLKWEFPGGKVEAGESFENCLKREISEELGLEVLVGEQLPANVHHYPDFSISLIPFLCKLISRSIQLSEHAAYRWLRPEELLALDWAEADIPIVESYLLSLKGEG